MAFIAKPCVMKSDHQEDLIGQFTNKARLPYEPEELGCVSAFTLIKRRAAEPSG